MQILWWCLHAVWTLTFTSTGPICFASRRASCVDWALRWRSVLVWGSVGNIVDDMPHYRLVELRFYRLKRCVWKKMIAIFCGSRMYLDLREQKKPGNSDLFWGSSKNIQCHWFYKKDFLSLVLEKCVSMTFLCGIEKSLLEMEAAICSIWIPVTSVGSSLEALHSYLCFICQFCQASSEGKQGTCPQEPNSILSSTSI